MAGSHLSSSGERDEIRENVQCLVRYCFVFRHGVEVALVRDTGRGFEDRLRVVRSRSLRGCIRFALVLNLLQLSLLSVSQRQLVVLVPV